MKGATLASTWIAKLMVHVEAQSTS